MTRAALLTLAVQWAATVTDAHGFHFKAPPAVVEAIVDGALADPLWPGDEGQRDTAAIVLVFVKHESGFQPNPRGSNDHGAACGLMQKHATGELCLRLRHDPALAVQLGIRDLRASMMVNAAHPWAAYAGSGLAAIRISDARSAEAHALLVTP